MSYPSPSLAKVKNEYTNVPQSLHPEVVPNGGNLEVVPHDGPESYQKAWSNPSDGKIPHTFDGQNSDHSRYLCGLTPKILWAMIFLIVIILAAGIGPGLGVGLSKSNNSTAGYFPFPFWAIQY